MALNQFVVGKGTSLECALQAIEANKIGLVFVCDEQKKVIGVATDGDIRRKILAGGTFDGGIEFYMNPDFFWAPHNTPRETLLKNLDSRITAIPLIDENGVLQNIFTSNELLPQPERSVYARAKSPVRISFGGGGSDVTRYFHDNKTGAVINTTISIFSHACLRIRDDSKIFISSQDLNSTLEAADLTSALQQTGDFGLILGVLKIVQPDFGFDLYLHSDFPICSGLGGSAAISAAILGCFNQFRRDKWTRHELSELAYQAERHYFGVAGGWQDQYATVFGGFNFIEFEMEQNIVHPLRIPQDILSELEESLILCNTGIMHNSGHIHRDQLAQLKNLDTKAAIDTNVKLSYENRNNLLRGDLFEFGKGLDKAWNIKKTLSPLITNEYIDSVYDGAIKNGALGGKLLGAGGGGFFLFFVEPFQRLELTMHLNQQGLKIKPFQFENKGLRSWMAREKPQRENTVKHDH